MNCGELNGEVFNDSDPIDIVVVFAFALNFPVKRAVEKGWVEVLRKRLFELADASSKRVPFSPQHCFFQRALYGLRPILRTR